MAQGLQGLNRGGGYDWETPYLNYLLNLPEDQQEYGQKLYDEYIFAKDYISKNNINLGQGPIEDYTNLFHNIYTKFGQGVQPQEQLSQEGLQPQQDSILMSLDTIVPDVPEFTQDNLRPLDETWMEEAMPYIRGEKEVNKQSYAEYIEDVGKKVISGELDLPDNRDFSTVKDIKSRAQEISPEWKMAGENSPTSDAGKLKVSNEEWLELGAMYDYLRQTEGQDVADGALQSRLKRMAANQQGFGEQMLRGFGQMGAEAFGATVSLIGVLGTAITAAPSWAGEKAEGRSGWQGYWDYVLNNPITRYGSDVIKYGTLDPEYAEMLKENGGMNALQIYRTPEAESGSVAQQIFNWSTIPTLIGQYGFTAASMASGAAEAKLAGAIFKGLGKGAAKRAATRGVTREALVASEKALDGMSKAEKFTYGFLIPSTQAVGEAAIEGLDLYDRVYEEGMKNLEEIQSQLYQNTLDDYLKSGKAEQIFSKVYRRFHEGQQPKILSIEDELKANPPEGSVEKMIRDEAVQEIMAQINAEYQSKFDAAKAQIKNQASRAELQNFTANVALLTFSNSTGKIGLSNPKTQKVLSQLRLTRWAIPGKNVVNDAGEVVTKYGVVGKAFDILKEPLTEGIEEGSQELSSKAFGAIADWNIQKFVDNRYNGETMDDIGTIYGGQLAAALSALGEALTSKDTYVAAIYGALSSGIGGVSLGLSNGFQNYRSVNAKGETQWDIFSRRVDSEGNRERLTGYLSRVAPWRSSFAQGISTVREKQKALEVEAQAMREWLSDPDNKARFKDATASATWAKQLSDYAFAGDEFGYRNSNLGKAVNDAFMLAKLRKTNPGVYKSLMDIYEQAAQFSAQTEAGQKFLDEINANKTDENKLTEEDVRNNAKKFLEIMEKAQQEDENVKKSFGEIDEEVRQALVYGRLAIEDFNKRGKQLEEEIGQVIPKTGLKDSVEGTVSVTEQIDRVVAKYGNTKEALEKAAANLRVKAGQKDEESDKLKRAAHKDSKSPSIRQERTSQSKKAKEEAKALRREAKSIDEALKLYQDLQSGAIVKSESQILNADPVTRAEMLNPANLKKYSKQQQDVIQRVINAGQQAIGPQFLSKVIDDGKLSEVSQNYISEYSNLISNPNSLKLYTEFHKREVQAYFAKKQGESLAKINDFTEFSNALDKARYQGSKAQQNVIFRTLKEKAPSRLEGYLKFKADSEELLNQLQEDEAFENLFDDDKALMTYAVNYLANSPISDTEAYRDHPEQATAKLLEKDENGNSRFKQYVESVLPENVSISRFDLSDEHVANLYRTLIERANKNRDNIQNATVETPTDSSEANPVKEVEPTPGENKSSEKQKSQNNPPAEPNIDSTVAEQVNQFRAFINSTDGNPDPKNALALEAIEELNLNTAEDVTDLLNQLTSIINRYKTEGGTEYQKAATVLDWVKVKSMNKAPQNIFSGRTPTYPDSKDMTTFQLVSTKWSTDPASPNYRWFYKLAKDYRIVEFLKTGAITAETPVYFYTNQEYWGFVKGSMKSAGLEMGVTSYPLIAVVEVTSEEDKDFAFPVEGKNANGDPEMHYYRPIGVMPDSLNKDYNGTASSRPIREAIDLNNLGKLITDQNGQVLEGRVKKIVGQIPAKGGTNPEAEGGYNRRDLIDLMVEAFLPESEVEAAKEALKDSQKRRSFLKSDPFKNLVNRFFEDASKSSKFKKKRNKGVESLYYTASTLFIKHTGGDDPNQKDWIVATKDLINTTNLEGKSFVDVLKSGNAKDIRNFNSRTRRYIDTMISILKDFNPVDEASGSTELSVTRDGENHLVNTNDALKKLETISKELNENLRDFITFRTGINAEYSIQLAENEDNNGYHYNLILKNNLGDINLGSIWESTFNQNKFGVEEAANILTNLCLDENVGIRTDPTAGKYRELVKWGVSYPDIMGTSSNPGKAADNRLDLITDNILAMSVSSLIMQPYQVEIHSPGSFGTPNKAPVNPETTVAQPDQATTNPNGPAGQHIEAVTSNGTTVQEDGLVVEQGKQKPSNDILIGDLTSRSISSRENVEVSSDGTTLTVAGATTYYRLPNLMNVESSTELSQDTLNTFSVMGYEVISSPITVRFQLPVTNMDGTTVQVNLANDQVRLIVDYEFQEPKVGILIQTNKFTQDVQEMLALTWYMTESYLGRNIDFARVSLSNNKQLKKISRETLQKDIRFDTAISKVFIKELNKVATPGSSAISTQSEEVNVSHVNPVTSDDTISLNDDFSDVDNFELDVAEQNTAQNSNNTPSSNLPKELQQPEIRYGVWRRENGVARTQENIQSIKESFKAIEKIHNEQEYNAWLENQLSAKFDATFIIKSIQQIIDCS